MPGRTTRDAWNSYIDPMNGALLCIAKQKSFVVKELPTGLIPEQPYSVALNDMDSVPLQMVDPDAPRVYLVAGQTIKIYEWHPSVPKEKYRVQALSYTYAFTTMVEEHELEILTFQWKRQRTSDDPYPSGHLHVGAAVLAKPTVIRPDGFHKAHIPTKRLSFESVVRFAITDLGVKPQRKKWQGLLAASEAAFEEHQTD